MAKQEQKQPVHEPFGTLVSLRTSGYGSRDLECQAAHGGSGLADHIRLRMCLDQPRTAKHMQKWSKNASRTVNSFDLEPLQASLLPSASPELLTQFQRRCAVLDHITTPTLPEAQARLGHSS